MEIPKSCPLSEEELRDLAIKEILNDVEKLTKKAEVSGTSAWFRSRKIDTALLKGTVNSVNSHNRLILGYGETQNSPSRFTTNKGKDPGEKNKKPHKHKHKSHKKSCKHKSRNRD